MVAAPPPVLAPLKPCYVSVRSAPDLYSSEALPLSGTGFAPGERLTITVGGAVAVPSLDADANGALPPQSLMAPAQPAGERAFTVDAVSRDSGRTRASVSTRVTALSAGMKPGSAKPQQVVRISGRGFTSAAPIYAHYIRRNALRRTVQLASAPKGACGRFSVKRPQFPFKPTKGVWRVQIDQHPDLVPEGPLVNLSIDVRPRPVTD